MVNGSVVQSLNGLKDIVTLAAGTNMTITPNGNTLTLAAAGAGGSGIWSVLNNNAYYNAGNVGIGTTTPVGQLQAQTGEYKPAVYGVATGTGTGVAGESSTGIGVYASSGSGEAGYFNGRVYIAGDETLRGNLFFGSSTRQMITLYDGGVNANLGIGVQNSALYNRTGLGAGFAWYKGGVHSNTQNDPGAGGTTLMTLDSSGNLKVTGSGAYAVWGNNPNGGGVYGSSGSAFGVYGGSATASGVEGHSGSGDGMHGFSSSSGSSGVHGENTTGTGVTGTSGSGDGMYASSGSGNGVESHSGSGSGVYGGSTSGFGVFGESSGAGLSGVYGITHSSSGSGVVGETYVGSISGTGGAGVTGIDHAAYGTGIHGIAINSGYSAGYFDGGVYISDNLGVGGTKNFKIDHPLDPANKYLLHASIESPDVKNLYDGNVTTDASGEAIVTLPTYFEALNRDFRYQLTVLGQFAQAIVSSEIKDNQFVIKTDKPNVKVSWQVTGIRQDAYMKAHPMVVEQDKPAHERGTYQHPELFGQPEEKGLSWSRNPELWKRLKKERIEQAALPKP